MTAPVTIAVSGIHLGENPQPGPGVIRSLREAMGDHVRIVGLAYDAMDSSLYARDLLDDAFLVPYPSAGPSAYWQRLKEIHAQIPLNAIIPCLDTELPVLAELADTLAAEGIRSFLPRRGDLVNRSKERLTELAQRVNIATPETHRVFDAAVLPAMGDKLGYPYMLKGPYCDAETVRGPGEATSMFARLASRWGLPLLAQRFVEGEEYDVVCLGDGEGGMPGAVAMRKTMLTRMGKAWGAVTIEDPTLISAARRVVSNLRWRGGCEVELLRERNGRVHLIEINPRFPAWVYLATAAGVNLPEGLLSLALHGKVSAFPVARPGVFYVRHATETTGTLEDMDTLVTRGTRSWAPPSATQISPQ
ncbi:MAG TPA: ATP-grasp domain-containing protein [Polyangiaceae bacterium]